MKKLERTFEIQTRHALLASASMATVGALAAVAIINPIKGQGRSSESNQRVRNESHFSVTCPEKGVPSIFGIANSDSSPILLNAEAPESTPLEEKAAAAVVRLTCYDDGQPTAPKITEDTIREGVCLGYNDESHLMIKTHDFPERPTKFFTESFNNMTEIGAINPDFMQEGKPFIAEVGLSRHNLDNPSDKQIYEQNNCDQPAQMLVGYNTTP